MSPSQIEFRVGAADPQAYTCGLLRTAVARGARLLVRVEPAQLEAFDQLLWTFSPQDFLAHSRVGDGNDQRSPVLLTDSDDLRGIGVLDCLVNLAASAPTGWQDWSRLIEVVGADPAARQAARQRFRQYRDAGCTPTSSEISP